jgi:hypothetical protein
MTISVPKTMKKFEIESTKSFVPNLEKAERVGEVLSIQSYNPIYNIFFQDLDDTNYNDYSFKQNDYIVDHNHVSKDPLQKNTKHSSCTMFIKSAPLIDPIHYLIGKYSSEPKDKWLNLPQYNSTEDSCMKKILSPNNTCYIDTFFNFLSSQVLQKHKIQHGIIFYGSFLGIQKRFHFNAYDDIEYLQESDFFLGNNKILYEVDESCNHALQDGAIENKNTQSRRPRLNISANNCIIEVDEVFESTAPSTISSSTLETNIDDFDCTMDIVYEKTAKKKKSISENSNGSSSSSSQSGNNDSSDDDNSDSDSDSSSINYSTDEDDATSNNSDNEDEDEDEDEMDVESTESNSDDDDSMESCSSSESDNENLPLYIYNFPVQMIALERCDGTLDELLEKELLTDNEIIAALTQVIFTLITYQKMFSFTHNDLHTNNIVFKKTKEKFLFYEFERKQYKVPTYGRIYKIIDFGRSIYKFDSHIFCSDSFAPYGDANGQYNTEPYLNSKKPRLEPNPSFDLSRLGCSMYNFFIDPDEDLPKDMNEVQKLVHFWCLDDNKMNILYKRNGDERYPNFKLYKMIARLVHDKTPQSQLALPVFQQFETPKVDAKSKLMNIDILPVYWK